MAASLAFLAARTRTPPETARAVGAGRSIAVLPFDNLGGNAEDDYLADGLTATLTTELARVPGLLVISSNSAFQYRGKPVDLRRIGHDLEVTHLLSGGLQRSGKQLRLSAQLVDLASGFQWEEKAFVEIEKALDPELAEAYVARGHLTWTRSQRFPHESAMRDFRRALEINPNLVGARWAAARVYQHVGLFDRALAELEVARRLDPKDRTVLDRRAKVRAFQREYPFHHGQYRIGAAYSLMGHTAKAIESLQAAAAQGFPCYPYFATDPDLAPLSGNEDFRSFMARLNTQWERYRAIL